MKLRKFLALKRLLGEMVKKSDREEDPGHAKITLKWLKRICPEACEESQIAALAHDIERAVHPAIQARDYPNYDDYLKRHSQRSAMIINKLMKDVGYEYASRQAVSKMVRHHEIGGDIESDLIKEADSLAFFNHNLKYYLRRKGVEKSVEKIRFMYNRTSDNTKKLVLSLTLPKKIREVMESAIIGSRDI